MLLEGHGCFHLLLLAISHTINQSVCTAVNYFMWTTAKRQCCLAPLDFCVMLPAAAHLDRGGGSVQGTAEEDILQRTSAWARGVDGREAGTHKVAETDRSVCNSLLASLHRVTAAKHLN